MAGPSRKRIPAVTKPNEPLYALPIPPISLEAAIQNRILRERFHEAYNTFIQKGKYKFAEKFANMSNALLTAIDNPHLSSFHRENIIQEYFKKLKNTKFDYKNLHQAVRDYSAAVHGTTVTSPQGSKEIAREMFVPKELIKFTVKDRHLQPLKENLVKLLRSINLKDEMVSPKEVNDIEEKSIHLLSVLDRAKSNQAEKQARNYLKVYMIEMEGELEPSKRGKLLLQRDKNLLNDVKLSAKRYIDALKETHSLDKPAEKRVQPAMQWQRGIIPKKAAKPAVSIQATQLWKKGIPKKEAKPAVNAQPALLWKEGIKAARQAVKPEKRAGDKRRSHRHHGRKH